MALPFETVKLTLSLEFTSVETAYHKFLQLKHSENNQTSTAMEVLRSAEIEWGSAVDEWKMLLYTLTDGMKDDDKIRIESLFAEKPEIVECKLSET
jgi:hypothetical protein